MSMTACSSKTEDTWVRVNNRYGYSVKDCVIDNENTYITEIDKVICNDNTYYVCVHYHDDSNEESSEIINSVIVVDADGNVEKSYQLEDNSTPQCIIDDCLMRVDNGKIYKYSVDDGALIDTEDSLGADSFLICPSSTGYVVFYPNKAVKYDTNNQEIGRVDFEESMFPNNSYPYFEDEGNEYIVFQDTFCDYYYQVSFDANSMVYKLSTNDISSELSSTNGKYIIDGVAEYKVNIESSNIEVLADFDYLNLKPEGCGHQSTSYYSFDDNHFAVGYSYYGGSIELQLFEYDNSIDYSNAETIEIGGFNISHDLPLRWAIYKFNTSQDDYRVITTDYSEMFNWETTDEAQNVKLELITYLNNGNAPDIFYGAYFDYKSFYDSGLVIDMTPYCQTEEAFESGSLIDSIENLMDDEGVCYNVFAGFCLSGFWGKTEHFQSNDVSIYDMRLISEETGILPLAGEYSHNIVDSTIRYSINQRMRSGNSHLYELDELVDVVEYSIDYGIAFNSIPNEIPYFQLVEEGMYLSCNSYLNDIYYLQYEVNGFAENMQYIGYPSVDGSVRLVEPWGLVGISSSSEHPDVCWDIISMLFDDDVQRIVATNQSIPVVEAILDEFCNATMNPKSVDSNSMYYSYVCRQQPVDSETVNLFVDSIESANTLLSYDWGVYNIICEEVDSYDLQGRSVDVIAETLQSRLDLYISENS